MKWWVALGMAWGVVSGVGGEALAEPYALYIDAPLGRDDFGAALAGGDFDGDGYADLAVGAPDSNGVFVYRGAAVGTFPQQGAGLEGRELEEPLDTEGFGALLAADDFDGDGVDDLAVGDEDGQVWVYYGQDAGGGLALGRAVVWDFPELSGLFAVGDLNNDGRGDLALVTTETVDCECGLEGEGEAKGAQVFVAYSDVFGELPDVVEVGLPDGEWCGCAPVDGDLCDRDCGVGAAVIGPSMSSVEGRFLAIGAPGVEVTGRVWVYVGEGGDWLEAPSDVVTGRADGSVDGTRIGGALAKLSGGPLGSDMATLLVSGTPSRLRTYTRGPMGYEEGGRPFERWLPSIEAPVFATVLFEGIEPKLFVVDAAAEDEGRLYLYDEDESIAGTPTRVIVGGNTGQIRAPMVVVGEMNVAAPALGFGVEVAARLVDPPGVLLLVDGIAAGEDGDGDTLVEGVDGCPDLWSPMQLDADYDGVPDACDCASDSPRDDLACEPRDFALFVTDSDPMCLDEGDPNLPVYNALRDLLGRRGHPTPLVVEGLAQPEAVDVVVLVGDAPLRDDHRCAIDRFVDAGGSALDLRRSADALGGVDARIPAPEAIAPAVTAAVCTPSDDVLTHALCDGLANVPYVGGMTAGRSPPGEVFLRTLDGRAMGLIQTQGAGRIVVLGSGGFEHDEPLCGRSGVLDRQPARRLMGNVIDALTPPRAEPVAEADTEACYGGPALTVAEMYERVVLGAYDAVEIPFTVFDVATPVEALLVEVAVDEERPFVRAEAGHVGGMGTLTLTALGRPGSTIVELKAIDADGEWGAVVFEVEVACEDIDADGVCDDVRDADGDGIADGDDNCVDVPNPGQEDVDLDGIGDACDACEDIDADTVCAGDDNCPQVWNDDQGDGDGDGIGDACDDCDDPDMDEICTPDDICPYVADADQRDSDGDGVGDACVGDADGDLLSDAREAMLGTDPNDRDTDGDGFDDFAEVDFYGTDPLVADGDRDGDGWPDAVDRCPFVPNPAQEDGDGDGVGDHCDLGDGHEESDEEIQGLQLGGEGCRAAPGREDGRGWWWLLLGVVVTRRRGESSDGG